MDITTQHNKYLDKIIKKIEAVDPRIVIIFGSYIKNKLSEDSDLDLLVVLDIDRIPSSYDEKIKMKLKVRKSISEINRNVAIDLLVYTIPEYEELIKSDSSFSKELKETGKIIYEKASTAMA
ncbi:MAG: hypothetical protein DRP57_11545 [Spirochaetes bacterium]|nr:MAG: hypothetical protein DRP57_11545 [Spirochaetota bacterium]